MMIVGAYEFKPGLMYVEQYNYDTQQVEELIVYTDDYYVLLGQTEFPFANQQQLMAEEDLLPPIPDWPSIFTTPDPIK